MRVACLGGWAAVQCGNCWLGRGGNGTHASQHSRTPHFFQPSRRMGIPYESDGLARSDAESQRTGTGSVDVPTQYTRTLLETCARKRQCAADPEWENDPLLECDCASVDGLRESSGREFRPGGAPIRCLQLLSQARAYLRGHACNSRACIMCTDGDNVRALPV